MIIGCVNAYNEGDLLPGCLASIKRQVDMIVLVDGAYRDYPLINGRPESTDDTLRIAKGYGCRVISCGKDPWDNQEEKRNRYLIGCSGDWYLIIDADERLCGNLRLAMEQVSLGDAINIRCYDAGSEDADLWPRMLRHQDGIRYAEAHNAIWVGPRLIRWRDAPALSGVHIDHLSFDRPKERRAANLAYYERQMEHEAAARIRHRIE